MLSTEHMFNGSPSKAIKLNGKPILIYRLQFSALVLRNFKALDSIKSSPFLAAENYSFLTNRAASVIEVQFHEPSQLK